MIKRTFKAFAYRDFRLMWLGACTSSIGSQMQLLAQAWLVYQLSNSPIYLGLDTFCGQIPIFLFSLFGGVFADRKSRRHMLLASQYIQMGAALLLTALVLAHVVRVWQVLCLSFVVGTAQSFGGPAYQALIPSLVGKDDLQNAIAMNSIQFNIARVVGPTLGGIALNGLGAAWCFGLNSLSFLAVIGSLLAIHAEYKPEKTSESVLESMKQGFTAVRNQPGMSTLIALAFWMALLTFPLVTFMPIFANDVLHGDARTFALLLSVFGAGAVVGALMVAGRRTQQGQARYALMSMVVLGALIAGFGLSTHIPLSAVLLFCAGVTLMIVFALNASLAQTYVGDAMRGRVMSVYNVAFRGGMPIGSVVCGFLIKKTSAPVIISANGALICILALYYLLVERKVAKL